MSLAASERSIPYSNSRVIIETLSDDLEVRSFKSSTVLRLSSSTRVMLVSISVALAPGYVVITEIIGISISGYWSTAKLLSEKRPNTITATNIRAVEIGFLTALSYIFIIYLFSLFAYFTSTSAPSRKRENAVTATCSPASRPETTSTIEPI